MNIYIVTENNFFFIGVKEKLAESGKTIKMIPPLEFNIIKVDEFSDTDTFIFHVESYSTELSLLLITRKLPGRIIFTQAKRKPMKVSMLGKYITLGYNEGIDMLMNELNDDLNYDRRLVDNTKKLTERELDILSHVMGGMKVSTIGRLLCISTKTVYAHKRNAMNKLGGRNMFEIFPLKENVLRSVFSKTIPG
ncbi:helix-turn-helix transcriptional regulator [Serratia fonticola]|uniref:helix-turn-helix transcriptional regulator n=1 Tax=Serratia fonticola TaxID=47917 RepID=UPI003AF37596